MRGFADLVIMIVLTIFFDIASIFAFRETIKKYVFGHKSKNGRKKEIKGHTFLQNLTLIYTISYEKPSKIKQYITIWCVYLGIDLMIFISFILIIIASIFISIDILKETANTIMKITLIQVFIKTDIFILLFGFPKYKEN